MSRLTSLRGQVERLRAQIPLPSDPREWFFILGEDEPIPPAWQSRISAADIVTSRYVPAGYIEGESDTVGFVTTTKTGQVSLLLKDARKQKVTTWQNRHRR